MTGRSLRVLVTAIEGDLGQALSKALRLTERKITIFGCDVSERGVGGAFVEQFICMPSAENPAYLSAINEYCHKIRADVIIPGSEAEMYILGHAHGYPNLPCGTKIVCQDGNWFDRFGDKLNCMEALEGKVKLAPFADGANPTAVRELVKKNGFPLVVKARRSRGSLAVRIVRSEDELAESLICMSSPLVQAFIDEDEGEYSVGMFSCESFSSVISFRRSLGPVGCTWTAEMSEDAEVNEYAVKVMRVVGLRGSANLQVRKSTQGVKLLEINPRFSSLVAARAACGFNDVAWAIGRVMGSPLQLPPSRFQPIRFWRYFHEMVDLGDGPISPLAWQPKNVHSITSPNASDE